MKTVKRAMAGEFLRELSVKVFAGQCRIARQGFKMGGRPGYGLRRMLVSREHVPKGVLEHGDRKNLALDRVLYVAGPAEEIRVVRQVYAWYLDGGLSMPRIAHLLNQRGVARPGGTKWTHNHVYDILTHPKYAGCVVFNRTSRKLGSRQIANPPEQWIVTPNCFEPLVSPEQFAAVQQRRKPLAMWSDEEFLDGLRGLLQRHGTITMKLIRSTPGLPSPESYRKRFGSLGRAYDALGDTARGYVRGCMLKCRFKPLMGRLTAELIEACSDVGLKASQIQRGINIRGWGKLRIELGYCDRARYGLRWEVRLRGKPRRCPLLVARLSEDGKSILGYNLFEQVPAVKVGFTLREQNIRDQVQFSRISDFVAFLAER